MRYIINHPERKQMNKHFRVLIIDNDSRRLVGYQGLQKVIGSVNANRRIREALLSKEDLYTIKVRSSVRINFYAK